MKEAKINIIHNLIPNTPHSPYVYFDDLWWDDVQIININLANCTLECIFENSGTSINQITEVPRYIYDQICYAVQKHFITKN